jgi:hypothetical protein
VSGNITVNVAKASGTFGSHVEINTTYTPTLTLANLSLSTGYVWNTPETGLNAGDGQQFSAAYTEPSGNYESVSGNITVNVAKAAGAEVDAPTLYFRTYNSITINTLTAPNEQQVEYAISTSSSVPSTSTDWQTSTTFINLDEETGYYIFARAKESGNYNLGAVSISFITTLRKVSEERFEYYWVDKHGALVTTLGNATTVNAGETLTITRQDDSYVVKQWYLNGLNTGQSGESFVFLNTTVGTIHAVGLLVEKDGKLYNTNITITVQ